MLGQPSPSTCALQLEKCIFTPFLPGFFLMFKILAFKLYAVIMTAVWKVAAFHLVYSKFWKTHAAFLVCCVYGALWNENCLRCIFLWNIFIRKCLFLRNKSTSREAFVWRSEEQTPGCKSGAMTQQKKMALLRNFSVKK